MTAWLASPEARRALAQLEETKRAESRLRVEAAHTAELRASLERRLKTLARGAMPASAPPVVATKTKTRKGRQRR